ncbi:hypothetical protein [Cellulosimicrobium sp. Marseille-Q4280]|uniref:hypothetical protein n=1 Tax=Cellulosimicrobium sp. Marseille-Q4280 TaxID=2937992 RepID=UPI00203D6472|nr:hypothetical protein [Cellulosimicrobium sp. Marseille-Q4280]
MTFLITSVTVPILVAFTAGVAVVAWCSPRPPRWVKLLSPRHRRHAAAVRHLHASQNW